MQYAKQVPEIYNIPLQRSEIQVKHKEHVNTYVMYSKLIGIDKDKFSSTYPNNV